jgi:hypothetical protein
MKVVAWPGETWPKVHIVATGGSISGIGPHRLASVLYSELGQRLSIEEILARIPDVQEVAQVESENLIRVGVRQSDLRSGCNKPPQKEAAGLIVADGLLP